MQNKGMTKKIIATSFCTTQQATNFNNVQIELIPVIAAAKLFLRFFLKFCFDFIHISRDTLLLPTEDRNTEAIGD